MMLLIMVALAAGCTKQAESQTNGKNILAIVPHGFGVNYFLLRDVVDQYGYSVTCAGLTDTVQICGPFAAPRGGVAMTVDTLISQINDISGYDAVVILSSTQFSGENPFVDIMGDSHTMGLIAAAAKKDMPILVSCAGVRVLAALNLLDGKTITGSPKYQQEYEEAGATYMGVDFAPQTVGNLITSTRGQYNNIPNGTALSAAIEARESVSEAPTRPAVEFIEQADANFTGEGFEWSKTFGGNSADGAGAVCETEDGGLLLAGYTYSHGSDNTDILAIKTDGQGNMIWSKTYGGPGSDYGYAVIPVADGFVLTGYTTSIGAGSKDVYLLKIDLTGEKLWSHAYGGDKWDVGTAVCQTNDGGYAVCGYTTSEGAGEEDIYLIRTDAGGELLWSRTFGGEKTDMGIAVMETSDGGFAIGSSTNSFGGSNSDFYLIKTDAQGIEQWAKAYHPTGEHGHGFDWGTAMCVSPDGGFFIAGHSDCNDLMDAFVIKLDADGDEIWSKAFGGDFYDYATAVKPTSDGGVFVCGATKTPFNNNDIFLARLDNSGNITANKTIGGPGAQWASSLCLTRGGDCIVAGQTSGIGD